MKKLLSLMLGILMLLPAFPTLSEEAPGAKGIFELLQAGEYDAVYSLFDENVRAGLNTEDLQTLLPQLEASMGPLLRIGKEKTSPSGAYTVTTLRLSYQQGDLLFTVTWQKGQIAGMYFYPTPAEPVSTEELPRGLTEEEISVGDPGLPGVLTLPKDANVPLPAVVLLHGSGPNDRDESIGQTKLFRDLAWSLAPQGVAVLRFDKRTYVYGGTCTQKELMDFTARDESMRDAAAAAELLRADPRIDPRRIYLIGHSLGAMLAPRIAQENPGLFCGIVLLSGSPKTLADIVLNQNQAAVNALPIASRFFGQLQVDALRKNWEAVLTGTAEEARQQTVFGQPAYYFWEMAQHDTASILQALDLPVLIINGGQDFQVTDADGIDAWRALEMPDNAELIYHPDLNHVLMRPDAPDSARGTTAEYNTPCQADEAVIQEIADFILK